MDPMGTATLPQTNIKPENQWLEFGRWRNSFWAGLFSVAFLPFAVRFMERKPKNNESKR